MRASAPAEATFAHPPRVTIRSGAVAGPDQDLAARCTFEEVQRAARFLLAEDRDSYLAAHGLLRLALAEDLAGRMPATARFRSGAWGKPYLPTSGGVPWVRFNLAHCRSRVCCVTVTGVAAAVEVGIDVEPVCRVPADALPRWVCTAREQAVLAAAADADRAELFARLWTAKEAVVKALGTGLALPLEQVEIELTEHGAALRGICDVPQPGWRLLQAHRVGPGTDRHIETVAVCGAASTVERVEVLWCEPSRPAERISRAER